MANISARLQEVYTGMCQVMRCPQAFGLGNSVPTPLARSMERWLRTFGEIMQEECEVSRNRSEDLEAELSQDADRRSGPRTSNVRFWETL
jgi:hypothetical protein